MCPQQQAPLLQAAVTPSLEWGNAAAMSQPAVPPLWHWVPSQGTLAIQLLHGASGLAWVHMDASALVKAATVCCQRWGSIKRASAWCCERPSPLSIRYGEAREGSAPAYLHSQLCRRVKLQCECRPYLPSHPLGTVGFT